MHRRRKERNVYEQEQSWEEERDLGATCFRKKERGGERESGRREGEREKEKKERKRERRGEWGAHPETVQC